MSRWLDCRRFYAALAFALLVLFADTASAETWRFTGQSVSGNVEIRTFNNVRMAAVDQIADELGYKTSLQGEEFLVRGLVGMRFVRGAAAVWLGYSVLPLPGRTRFDGEHWWVGTDASMNIFSQFLKRNGRNVTLQWNGAGSRQPAKPAAPAPKSPAQPTQNQPSRLKNVRWGIDGDKIRAVLDLQGDAAPSYTQTGTTLTVKVGPIGSIPIEPYRDVDLKSRGDSLIFSFPRRTARAFMLAEPSRFVIDFLLAGDKTEAENKITPPKPTSDKQQQVKKSPQKPPAPKQTPKQLPAPKQPPKNRKKIILIDAGHGGKDPGAMAHGYREKVIALQISTRLANILRGNKNFDVRMTRTGDTYPTLKERTAMANNIKADVFVSIHLNALPKGRHAEGIEIYIMALPTDNDAMMLAKIENGEIAEEGKNKNAQKDSETEMLLSILGNMQQNAKIDESTLLAEDLFKAGQDSRLNMKRVAQAPFWVLRGAGMPSVLIETGFITELKEARQLARSTYQQKLAQAFAEGIIKFLNRY